MHTPNFAAIHWLPVAIFLLTYLLIAVESNLGSFLDRTAAAFCGAVAMVLAHVLTLDHAYQAIEWNTLIFLLGMMILVAHFRVSGFFDWIGVHVATIARTPFQLLLLLVFASGVLAAFFVNDTICLIFTPIVLAVTERLELPPAPYLIALATSANIGSSMAVMGIRRMLSSASRRDFPFWNSSRILPQLQWQACSSTLWCLRFSSGGTSSTGQFFPVARHR
jgi:Na+/H+ antiporter NhaD/arsenite permease-like protein